MSSERAGVHTPDDALDGIARTVRNWREGSTTHDEAGATDLVEDIEWFLDHADRAGVHTSGTLNREKASDTLRSARHARDYDPEAALDALEACVVPDPRLARIEALCEEYGTAAGHVVPIEKLRAAINA